MSLADIITVYFLFVALSSLVAASYLEDSYGVVQMSLADIITVYFLFVALSSLVAASYLEDSYGVVQMSLTDIITAILSICSPVLSCCCLLLGR